MFALTRWTNDLEDPAHGEPPPTRTATERPHTELIARVTAQASSPRKKSQWRQKYRPPLADRESNNLLPQKASWPTLHSSKVFTSPVTRNAMGVPFAKV